MPDRMKKNWWWALIGAVCAAVLLGHAMGYTGLKGDSLNFNDFAVLKYQVEAARRFHSETGLLWGYDPHYMAGYPLGFIWNSNYAIQWFAVRFGSAAAGDVVLWFMVGALLLFVPLWWWTLRNFGFGRAGAAYSMPFAGAYFMLGTPVMFFVAGMPTAGLVSYVAIFAASFVFRYARDGGWWWIGAAASVSLALFVHKTAALILFPVICFAAVWVLRRRRGPRLLGLAAAGLVALLVNLQWIRVVFIFLPHFENVPEAPFWRNTDMLRPLRDYFTGAVVMNNIEFSGGFGLLHTAVLWLLLIFGLAGMVVCYRRGARALAVLLGASAAGLWLYSYYGAFLPGGATLNPTRYFAVSQLLLAACCGAAVESLASGGGGRVARKVIAAIVVVAAIAGMVYGTNRLKPFRDSLLSWPVPADIKLLVQTIKQLPPGARIMLEDSGAMDTESGGQIYGRSQLPALFGVWTGREFIGGPYPYVYLDYRRASFYDGRAFGAPLADRSPDELLGLLGLYNVKWIVCWSGGAREYFRKYGGYYRAVNRIGRFEIFEVTALEPSYFLKGGGDVRADWGRIEVSNARAENGELVLKYHWLETRRTEPEIKIEKYQVEGDPVGFIRVKDPPEKFVIMMP